MRDTTAPAAACELHTVLVGMNRWRTYCAPHDHTAGLTFATEDASRDLFVCDQGNRWQFLMAWDHDALARKWNVQAPRAGVLLAKYGAHLGDLNETLHWLTDLLISHPHASGDDLPARFWLHRRAAEFEPLAVVRLAGQYVLEGADGTRYLDVDRSTLD